MFRGTFTALVTPFRNGAVDYPALEKLIDAQIDGGVYGLVANGTTAESPTLSHEERNQIVKLVIDRAKGRCCVLVGTGSNSTAHTIEMTREAEKFGAEGALVVSPYYNKPSQEGLFRHFQAVARETSLPIVLYNIPGRCAVDINADTVERLADACDNIVSIKEASGSVERVGDLRRRLPDAFTILSGDDGLILPFMSVGAVGVVSVASNIFPAEVAALVRAFRAGDHIGAQRMHARMLPLFRDLFIEPNPVPAKTVLSWKGAMSAEVRLPLCEMTPANQERLRNTTEAFELANR